tara:strand:- start:86 stop:286 length:201 start_codon:yes stop_codon:yes gene_type:complete
MINFDLTSTLFKKSSYLFLLFTADSLTIKLNVSLSKPYRMLSLSDIIVAALGALYNKANSPKFSPD